MSKGYVVKPDKNINKVPDRKWEKWDHVQRYVFNRNYTLLSINWKNIAPGVPQQQWHMISWDCAMLISESMRRKKVKIVA